MNNIFIRYQFTPESVLLVTRTVKTDHWAIAVNTQSTDVKNLTFTVSSVAKATLWGQWSQSALISRSGPTLGKYADMDFTLSVASYGGYVFFSADGAPLPAANRVADQTLFIRRIALRPSLRYFGKSSFSPTPANPSVIDRLGATLFHRDPPQAQWAVIYDDDDDDS